MAITNQAEPHILYQNMVNKYLHAAQDISYFCVKTLILNTLNIKCTTAFQKEKQTKN